MAGAETSYDSPLEGLEHNNMKLEDPLSIKHSDVGVGFKLQGHGF